MAPKQTWLQSHAETLAQNILGIFIAFVILRVYGLPAGESIKLQAIFFIASYARGYLVRRFFNSLNHRGRA